MTEVLHLTKNKGIDVHISHDKMKCSKERNLLFTATIDEENIGYLDGNTVNIMENLQLASMWSLDLSLWHKWSGHHNYDDFKESG